MVKSVGTFSVTLVKLATPPLPPQTKLNFEHHGWKRLLFLATTLLGGGGGVGGGRQDEPRADQKNVISGRVLRNNYLEGLFHTVPSCFVLHCGLHSAVCRLYPFIHLNLFVLRMDRVSQRINHYPLDKY